MSWFDKIKKNLILNADYSVLVSEFMDGKLNDKLHEIAPVLYEKYKNNNKGYKTFWSYIFFNFELFSDEVVNYLKQQKTE